MATNHDVIEDMLKQHPSFFERYEELATMYYKILKDSEDFSIPRSHCNALLELLMQSGYRLTKIVNEDNIVTLIPNVLDFRKKVT